MAVKSYRELIAWQLADLFKKAIFELLAGSAPARADLRFASQLREAGRGPAKHITEGFVRFSPRTFEVYLGYALSSIAEAEEHLQDGVELFYFTSTNCQSAFQLARRCTSATSRLKKSQRRFQPRRRD